VEHPFKACRSVPPSSSQWIRSNFDPTLIPPKLAVDINTKRAWPRRSPVVDEERSRPVCDLPWFGPVLYFSALTILVGERKDVRPTHPWKFSSRTAGGTELAHLWSSENGNENGVNNNNTNTNDNVYGAVIIARPLREFTRFIWWMQTERQMAANSQTKPNDLASESAGRLLPSTPTIAIY